MFLQSLVIPNGSKCVTIVCRLRLNFSHSLWPFQPLQSIPAEKIMKKPIPDEHMVLKTTFEGLIQKCLAVATDPVSRCDEDNSTACLCFNKVNYGMFNSALICSFHSKLRGSLMMPTNVWRHSMINWESRRWVSGFTWLGFLLREEKEDGEENIGF